MTQRISAAVLLFAGLLLSGCGAVKIGRINADPTRYRNRTVRVDGTVTTGVGILGKGGYQIEDETGKIIVVSTAGVPSRGSRVTVTGTVQSGVNLLGLNLGTALREQSHKVH